MTCNLFLPWLAAALFLSEGLQGAPAARASKGSWNVGTPIVTYWCGPSLSDAAADQMKAGGFNLVWCTEKELDVALKHGLRAQLQDGLLAPASLQDSAKRAKLDALIERVKSHPAMYAYFLTDEPSAEQFADWGKLVAYLRERDPAHLAYINLFPTYANNKQLGTQGDVVTAYREHLRQYMSVVKPGLVSYDHYQFALKKDQEQYFLNLAMIRRTAQEGKVPFLNIVQACTWAPEAMRVPNADEVRYLVYTTAAYGALGLSYYIYSCPNHVGGFALADGTPTPLYHAASGFNREFVAIMKELQPLRSLAVYHTRMKEAGCESLPEKNPFRVSVSGGADTARGFVIGQFGASKRATHAVVVNLDYKAPVSATIDGPGRLSMFDAATGQWSKAQARSVSVALPPGGGVLVRVGR